MGVLELISRCFRSETKQLDRIERLVARGLENQVLITQQLAILTDLIRSALTDTFITFLNSEGEEIDMLQMTDSQQATVPLKITDSRGKPAKVDGLPVWAIADTSVATMTVAADAMSALFVAVSAQADGNPATTTATVTADADLGPGVTTITAVLTIVVTSGQATVLELVPEAPVEQP